MEINNSETRENISAKFDLDLSQLPGYLCAQDISKSIQLDTNIDDFQLKVSLLSDKSIGLKKPDENLDRFFFNRAIMQITREQDCLNDDLVLRDQLYFLLRDYQPVVIEVLNRIFLFFKFHLRNPLITKLNIYDFLKNEKPFYNPQWLNSQGTPIKNSDFLMESGIMQFPGMGFLNDNFLGIQRYESSSIAALKQAISAPIDAPLYEELLSDAQAAAIQGNIRRAVMELAIATEVYVKNAFFARDSISAEVFEYMEDRGRTTVKVIELIDSGAEYALGHSFKKEKVTHYNNIDYIFRCRNKIAHRGDPTYRDDHSVWHKCSSQTLLEWWLSVIELINWLNPKLVL